MEAEKQVQNLPLEDVLPNRFQPRIKFSEESIEELANSIREHGVIQPIVVRRIGDKYEIIAGERRYKASQLAGKDTIPAIITNLDDNDSAEIALLENIQRENLTAIELAWAYKGIIDNLDIRQEDLAKKIGKSRSHITNTLGLLNLPEDVQKMILNGEISMGHARVLSKMEDEEEVSELADKIVKENMSVHSLEEISKNQNIKKRAPITRREINSDYSQIESEMREILGTKVKIDNKKINIYFENINDLNRLLEIMNIEIK